MEDDLAAAEASPAGNREEPTYLLLRDPLE
jgi:hypothetical protein